MKSDRILFVSHGDKGGVGKSVVSMFAVEKSLEASTVALIEADPTQPDLGRRYSHDTHILIGALTLNRAGDAENALSDFGTFLEQSGKNSSRVVVNLPAGAGETLDAYSDLILGLADSLDYRLVVTYSLEKNETATRTMLKSLESGLLSVVEPENRFIVFPTYKGEPETFHWFKSKERKSAEIGEIVMPALKNHKALSLLEASTGRLSKLTDKENRPAGWFIVDQISVYRFYQAGLEAIAPCFDNEEGE